MKAKEKIKEQPVEVMRGWKERLLTELVESEIGHKKVEEELLRYNTLVTTANAIIMAHDDEWRVTLMNPYACKVLGYKIGEMIGRDIRQMLEKSELERAEPVRKKVRIDPNIDVEGFEQYFWKKGKKGRVLVSWNVTAVKDVNGNVIGIQAVGQDITKRKKAEKALKESESKLKEQKSALERKNVALSELIAQIEVEKNKIKEDISHNVDELLLPIIEKLKLKEASNRYVHLLEEGLKELTSSFGSEITKKSIKLSPKEIEICNMVKCGLSSKEISKLLNISYHTVETHRKNIRKKLGISDRKINLISYLHQF